MKRALIIALALGGCAQSPPGVVVGGGPALSVEEQMALAADVMRHEERYMATIESFAALAAQSDVDRLELLIEPAVIAEAGEATYRAHLLVEIVPFFADYAQVDSVKGVAPAIFPDGRRGIAYYTYIITKSGARKPWSIWLLDAGDRTLVGFVDVNHCIAGRHPICD